MLIAIPLDENKNDVCVSFGRTPYFMTYDTNSNATNIIINPATSAQGGAGIKAAQIIVDNNIDILITIRCGENAAEVLKAAKIKIYQAEKTTALDNINKFTKGKLALLSKFHAGFHGK